MRRFSLLFLGSLLVAGASASPAAANVVYNVNFSDPNRAGGGGDVSVSGTITVDKLGSLSQSDFVGYSLTFSSPNYPSATLTTANSSIEYVQQGSTINATAASLSMSFPLASLNDTDVFAIYANNFDQSFQLSENYATSATREIFNGTGSFGAEDYSVMSLGTGGVTTVIGTAASAVPEPSSFVLAAIGITAVTGLQFRRRKPARA